jgi:membrane protein DedA with SNARE-associated domain
MGASQLLVRRFAAFAYAGALLWTVTFIGIGYGFGAEWSRFSPAVHRSVVITALTIALTMAVILSVVWQRGRGQH